MSLYEVNPRACERSLTAQHSVVLALPVVNLRLGLAAGPLGPPVAAVVLKTAPARHRKKLALTHSVVIYGHVIWMVFISMVLQAVEQ